MRRLLLVIFIAAIGFFGFGLMSAVADPRVAHYRLEMPGLAAPVRVVQLSDSHASAIDMPPQRIRRVVAMVNALDPDLIILTGDYVSGHADAWSPAQTAAALAPFAGLRAPLGVFAVLGNHDHPARTAAGFAGGPVRLLVGERVDTGPLAVVGVDDIARGSPAVEAMRRRIRAAPPGQPILVIAHEPSFMHWLPPRPVVMIAGHTHGGQIKLPLLGSWFPDTYSAAHPRGVYRERGQTLLVSSGLGTSLLPLRIGVPSEIVEVTLVPPQAGRNSGTDR